MAKKINSNMSIERNSSSNFCYSINRPAHVFKILDLMGGPHFLSGLTEPVLARMIGEQSYLHCQKYKIRIESKAIKDWPPDFNIGFNGPANLLIEFHPEAIMIFVVNKPYRKVSNRYRISYHKNPDTEDKNILSYSLDDFFQVTINEDRILPIRKEEAYSFNGNYEIKYKADGYPVKFRVPELIQISRAGHNYFKSTLSVIKK